MQTSLHYKRHLISSDKSVLEALSCLDKLAQDAILFVVDHEDKLLGSLTDGDVRRGLIKGLNLHQSAVDFTEPNPKYIRKEDYSLDEIIHFRENDFRIIPVLDKDNRIINVINFRFFKSYLPIDAVLMAGGRGERLRPLTDHTPKPLLKIGNKPIIEHNIDRLISFGIDDFWISIRYLGEQIVSHFQSGENKGVNIDYVYEDSPLGTIGAIRSIKEFRHDAILVSNSDLLTNLDYEDFYISFIQSGADLSVVTIPYDVNVPYAVLETSNGHVVSFKEKPTYTYYSNGGIYLMKKEVLGMIPEGVAFNATDLMEKLIENGRKVHSYPLLGYWLDIGKPEDYKKAQDDMKHIRL